MSFSNNSELGSYRKVTTTKQAIYYEQYLRPRSVLYNVTVTFVNVKMQRLLLLAALGLANAYPVLFEPIHTGIEYAPVSPVVHSHPAVELNAASEAQLPRELLKSNAFYDNPAIAAGLAKESWFTNKEMQVVEREAEKIPRQRIYDMVKGAGFLDQH